ncbi:hypothetical protein [Microbulbifer rhizosphaerae]|uniref:Uncharacterized protein n=1 Tax=Microbulbifer rhizosphaerae TaxID=1562603 RepID=A0A7W4W927_9GAMM|nr:hypothetical protein [Microbulbifer rhizosphaerae]MBB3059724.1 hypothetical protein [Microbulbifer rhizosphaerae]
MREFTQTIDEKLFNLLWRSLSEREAEISHEIEADLDSDESALLGNDLVYLRLCMKDLEKKAKEARFSESAFSLDDGYIDLSEL